MMENTKEWKAMTELLFQKLYKEEKMRHTLDSLFKFVYC